MSHTGAENTKNVSHGAHEDTRVLELGSDKTGNEKADYLEGSTSAIEQCSGEGAESQSLDDRTREVGQDAVGNFATKSPSVSQTHRRCLLSRLTRGSKHGECQEPCLGVLESRQTLLSVELGGLDTGTVGGDSLDSGPSLVFFQELRIGWTVLQEEPKDEAPSNSQST